MKQKRQPRIKTNKRANVPMDFPQRAKGLNKSLTMKCTSVLDHMAKN